MCTQREYNIDFGIFKNLYFVLGYNFIFLTLCWEILLNLVPLFPGYSFKQITVYSSMFLFIFFGLSGQEYIMRDKKGQFNDKRVNSRDIKHGISLHYLCHLLQFLSPIYYSFQSTVFSSSFIPRYFIHFGAVVNGIVFTYFSASSLFVYRNATYLFIDFVSCNFTEFIY